MYLSLCEFNADFCEKNENNTLPIDFTWCIHFDRIASVALVSTEFRQLSELKKGEVCGNIEGVAEQSPFISSHGKQLSRFIINLLEDLRIYSKKW